MRRSWIDWLVTWATSRRYPWWVPLGSAAVVLVVAVNAVKWIDGSQTAWSFGRQGFDVFYVLFGLFAYGYLAGAARKGIDRFRPALSVTDDEFDWWRNDLTTTPQVQALAALVAGQVLGVLAIVSDPIAYEFVTTSVLTAIVLFVATYSIGLTAPALLLVVRLLIRITRLHRRADRFDLFHPAPSHAFASVTARAGAVLIVFVTYSALTDPATFDNPVWVGVLAIAVVVAAVAFVLPLADVGRTLREQKQSLLIHNTDLTSEVTAAIEEAFRQGRLNDVPNLKATLEVFKGERERIQGASTAPWNTGTLRGFATTMLLPLFTLFATRVLGEWLGL